MKKILLIQPYIEKGFFRKRLKMFTNEPLGLQYIGRILQDCGHKVKIIDGCTLNLPPKSFVTVIKKWGPDIIGITSHTASMSSVESLAKITKEIDKGIQVIVGGPHISHLPQNTMERIKEIDLGVIGEGEYTMSEIADGIPLNKINGIIYRDGDRLIITKPRKLIENLDKMSSPIRDFTSGREYFSFGLRRPTRTIMTSRGCPFRCTFCSKLFGNVVRFRSPENIIDEWESLVRNFNAMSLSVVDDTFTLNKKRAMKICKLLVEKKLNHIPWVCQSRVDTVDKELLECMHEAGCIRIHYGIESASQRSLKEMKKGTTLKQINKSLKMTKEAGISTYGNFIFGFPNEDMKDLFKNLEFIRSNKNLDVATFHILQPFPGSEIFKNALREGTLISTEWSRYRMDTRQDSLLSLKYLSSEDLKRFIRIATFSFYWRWSSLFRHLSNSLKSRI